ncbi:MAG: TIR domain-containing protein [Mogibacterium sp.]|nr:TIR domain-containing protein [Mogibacterium sp.]
MARAEAYSAELVPYNEKNPEPFAFISYSHDEAVKVEGILRILERAGIRFWYDQMGAGIGGGSKWKEWVKDRLEKCSMFICFLSNGSEQRREVLNEIEEAIDRKKKDDNFKVLFILLEKIPAASFSNAGFRSIEEFIRENQYIMYNGITDRFIRQIFAEDVIPDRLVRRQYLESWQARKTEPLKIDEKGLFPENTYICETFFPEKDHENDFYKVRTDQIDPDAVCLICLDNQWCPPEFYNAPEFWAEGLNWHEGQRIQRDYQTKEIYRALLHHRQLIINRAFLYNSHVFEQWYSQTHDDHRAFEELLEDGSILVYLTTEKKPYDPAVLPGFATANYHEWGDVCSKVAVYCVRMDWTDEATNILKTDQLLFHRFENFCLSMAENKHLQEDMAEAFGFDENQRQAFSDIWYEVQIRAAARDRREKPSYTRDIFYDEFLIRKNTAVSDGILDINKAFAPELKEIVDLQYGLNLPEALGARPVFPAYGNLRDFYRSGQMLEHGAREITVEELSCAIGEFWPDFIRSEDAWDYPAIDTVSLSEVAMLRQLTEWKRYIRTVTNGQKRAHLQEVDFYDIAYVWNRFHEWMHAAKERMDISSRVRWQSLPGAVSLIYRLGRHEVITVYHSDSNEITVRSSIDDAAGIPSPEDHTVLVTVDYVCADILECDIRNNVILTEHRLFKGMSAEKLSAVYRGIMDRLYSMEKAGQITLRWNNKTPEELQLERNYKAKADSPEWRTYIELIQKASEQTDPEEDREDLFRYVRTKVSSEEWLWYLRIRNDRQRDFRQNEMLMIVTDLEEVCRFEMEHEDVRIGVRYHSPYSMLVVDLVRTPDGSLIPYERVLPAVPDGAVVCAPVYENKYVLIQQFRHSMRDYQLAFPRGYAEQGLSGSENAVKELDEELGVAVHKAEYIGKVVADSGLSGNPVDVYYCEVSRPVLKEGYEGIHRVVLMSEEEISDSISTGRINDGYTLSALELIHKKFS